MWHKYISKLRVGDGIIIGVSWFSGPNNKAIDTFRKKHFPPGGLLASSSTVSSSARSTSSSSTSSSSTSAAAAPQPVLFETRLVREDGPRYFSVSVSNWFTAAQELQVHTILII
jgi:hypothetical protein